MKNKILIVFAIAILLVAGIANLKIINAQSDDELNKALEIANNKFNGSGEYIKYAADVWKGDLVKLAEQISYSWLTGTLKLKKPANMTGYETFIEISDKCKLKYEKDYMKTGKNIFLLYAEGDCIVTIKDQIKASIKTGDKIRLENESVVFAEFLTTDESWFKFGASDKMIVPPDIFVHYEKGKETLIENKKEKESRIFDYMGKEIKTAKNLNLNKNEITGKEFEFEGMKVYREDGKDASLTVQDGGKYYTKSKGTIVETQGLKISGDEMNVFFSGGVGSLLTKDLGKNYIYSSSGILFISSGKESEIGIEFLEGNEFVNTNGKVKIKTKKDTLTEAEISDNGEGGIGVRVNAISGITIENGEGELNFMKGEMLEKAESVCRVYSLYVDKREWRECQENAGDTTPMSISIVGEMTPKGTGVEIEGYRNYIIDLAGFDNIGLQKCNYEETPTTLTGFASKEEGNPVCKQVAKLNLGGKNSVETINENEVKLHVSTETSPVEAIVRGDEYIEKNEKEFYGLITKDVYKKVNGKIEKVGYIKKEDGKWGDINYYSGYEPKVKEKSEPQTRVKILKSIGFIKMVGPIRKDARLSTLNGEISENEEDIILKATEGKELSKEEYNKLSTGKLKSWLENKGYEVSKL